MRIDARTTSDHIKESRRGRVSSTRGETTNSPKGSALRAQGRHLVQGNARGDGRVERLDGRRDRDRHDLIAGLAHEAGQARALGTSHDHEGAVRQRQAAQGRVAAAVEADHKVTGRLGLLEGAHQVRRASHGHAGGRTGRHLPRGRVDARTTTLGNNDAVRAERARTTQNRAQVMGIRHLIERDEERVAQLLHGTRDQIRGIGVLVAAHLNGDALVDGTFPDEDGMLKELYTALLEGASWHKPDHYFLMRDFIEYCDARLAVNRDYRDARAFAAKCVRNVANAGVFSSDRTILEYARDIWHV